MLSFLLAQRVSAINFKESINSTAYSGGTEVFSGFPGSDGPVANRLGDQNCYCGGGKVKVYSNEYSASFGSGYGCIGGCGGTPFEFHKNGQMIKTIQMWWGGGVSHDGVGAMCWILTDGTHQCAGGNKNGQMCEYTFDIANYEKIWTLALHGNGIGTRLGRLEFTTLNKDNKANSWFCGNSHTAYKATNVDGHMISGFFGQEGADIDQLGILLMPPACDVTKREITKIECVDRQGNSCLATWTDGGKWSEVEQTCDACKTTQRPQCSFHFELSETHSVTTTSSSVDQLGGSIEISEEFSESFFGIASAKETVKVGVTYSHTWSKSKSQTVSSTATVGSTCSVPDLDAGKAVKAYGMMHAGDMIANIKITVKETTTCGQTKSTDHDGQVTLSNVVILADVTQCTFEDVPCDATPSPTPFPTSEAAPVKWTVKEDTNIMGGDLGGCEAYPGQDIRADNSKLDECKKECQAQSSCLAIVAHEWGTMLKTATGPTEQRSGFKTMLTDRALKAKSLEQRLNVE